MEVFLTILILSIFIALTHLLKRFFSSTKNKLPPGPPKLPLIGNLHQLLSTKALPHFRLAELARVYGPIMHLHLGEVPTVVISSPEIAKEVMMTHDASFCSRPPLKVAKELFYGASSIGFAPYGDYWRQVRKIMVLELFTAKRVQSFRGVREEEVAQLMEALRSQAGSVVNLSSKLFGLTFNITSRIVFNKKGKEQDEFHAFASQVIKAASGFCIADLYPSAKWLHSISGSNRKLKDLVQESNRILDPIIDEHWFNNKSNNNNNHGNNNKDNNNDHQHQHDFLDVLLKFHQDNITPPLNDQFFLDSHNIKAVALEMFGAGSETSSTTIEWAICELLKNPEVMVKAQEEVRRVYQGNKVVDESRLHELTYLKLVIKETLRLHPPVPLLVPRESIEKCRIHSYDIPSKTRVLINVWAIGRDPDIWPDPKRFNPERFRNCSIDFKGTNFELIPFGAGRRKCPGMALGLANVEISLAMLLFHFNWKLPPGDEEPQNLNMDETYGATTSRKNQLFVVPIYYPYV